MFQFIESICCIDGELQLLDLHQARVNRTFFTNYGLLAKPIKLGKSIRNIPGKGKYKCRVVYNQHDFEIHFEPYSKRQIKSLQIVKDDAIDYRFKYVDRKSLDTLYHSKGKADDVLILRNGLLTDSYYANLAFFDGEEWWTPEDPLLAGVKRQYLLDQRIIKTSNLTLDDLENFEKVTLINAMLDISEVELPIEAIIR